MRSFKNKLFQETSIYSLVVARIAFGCAAWWECYHIIFSPLLYRYYVEPKFHFKYYGFEWIQNWPGESMGWFFCILATLAVFIVLGLFYRISIILFTLGFTYVFLIDRATYLNHFYMIILFGILLSFMPAHRYFSLDTYFNPRIKSEKISFWPIFLLRFQMEIILIFAGIAKINYDWLVRLMPLKLWLADPQIIAPLHYLFTHDWSLTIITYGIVILHLVGAPLLLARQTRIYIFAIYCCFHISNHFIFQIGSFPWLTLALTTIFFDPDWPKKIWPKKFLKFFDKNNEVIALATPSLLKQRITISCMAIWLTIQVLMPLRFLLYPGNVSWTYEGHNFAWRMKLNDVSGETYFYITDYESNQKERAMVSSYLTYKQYMTMQCQPEMILEFAHYIHKVWTEEKGYKNIGVSATAYCGMNGRIPTLLIDPNVDLARINISLKHSDWIMPLKK